MSHLLERIRRADWDGARESLHRHGYALIPGILSDEECEMLKADYAATGLYRKTVVMERYRFGAGEYKYFTYPLPDLIQTARSAVYQHLAPVANTWFEALKINRQVPAVHADLLRECRDNRQEKATPLILRYTKGGFNTLHQDLYGEVYFPLQMVFLLSQTGEDFTGGEFVLTQQVPRAQSKATVLQPGKGDLLIFTTNFKPEKGSNGYYRVTMKHGVSEVRSGERYALGVIFHDAES